MSERDDEGLLARWSRLKRRPEPEQDPEPPAEVDQAEADAPIDPEEDEAALLERLGLPNPDTLQPGDDFSAFMARNVPGFLRTRALRVLWRSNTALANLDGLLDYGEDFRTGSRDVVQTMYEVGKGFLKETAQEPDDTAPESDEAVADEPPEAAGLAPGAEPEEAESGPPNPVANRDDAPRERGAESAENHVPVPRRMVFYTSD